METASEYQTKVKIHLDNEAVVHQVQEMIQDYEEGQPMPSRRKHEDLYQRVWKCITEQQPGSYRVQRVKGHEGTAQEGQEIEWEGNQQVDEAARKARRMARHPKQIQRAAGKKQKDSQIPNRVDPKNGKKE